MNPPQRQVPGPSEHSPEDDVADGREVTLLRPLGPGPAVAEAIPVLDGVDGLIGMTIAGRYRITQSIATSAMSRVYRADELGRGELGQGREVALKLLHARDASADVEMYRKRFDREAASLARLSHPNIVRVLDHGAHAGMPYLVMEFIHGQTLRAYCSKRVLKPTLAIEIIDQLADALGEAHANGLVHRDVKPANVFVEGERTDELRVRLVDFGIAKDATDASEITGVDSVLGTPWYMAPEQAIGDPVDGRTDIYALGVLMFRLLVGCTPFSHLRGASVLVAHINSPVPAFESVGKGRAAELPAALEWTVRRCLEKSPDARFRDVSELRRALELCRRALVEPDRRVGMALKNGVLVVSSGGTAPRPSSDGKRAEPRMKPVPGWAWLVPAALAATLVGLWTPTGRRVPVVQPVVETESADALAAAAPTELSELSVELDEAGMWLTGTLTDRVPAPVGRFEPQAGTGSRYVIVLQEVDVTRTPSQIPVDTPLAGGIVVTTTETGLEIAVESGERAWGKPSLTSTAVGFRLHLPPAE